MNENYRKLIRNLRKGTGMFPPPRELQAIAAILIEEGIKAEICQPGHKDIPLTKAPLYAIRCETEGRIWAVTLFGGQLAARRVQTVEQPGRGHPVRFFDTRVVFFDLADPDSIPKVARHMEGREEVARDHQ